MQWNNVNEFLAMGGYALYVWGSYGAAVLLFAIEVTLLRRQRGDAMKQLKRIRRRTR